MVSTRSQNSMNSYTLYSAARTLVTLRNSEVHVPSSVITNARGPSYSKCMTLWASWYHAFLSEVTDENPSLPIAERRSRATSRWVSFASKQLHYSESELRGWLHTTDQKALHAASA
jgi:hypothetical protein